jgi:hypothetical protein
LLSPSGLASIFVNRIGLLRHLSTPQGHYLRMQGSAP